MLTRTRLITSFLFLAALSACKPEVTPGAPEPQVDVKPVATSPEVSSENGMLTVEHARIDLCKDTDGTVSSKIRWNASPAKTEGTEVWLQEQGKEPVLWSKAGAVFESNTGRWLHDGTEVILKNGENNKELARVKVTAIPCT